MRIFRGVAPGCLHWMSGRFMVAAFPDKRMVYRIAFCAEKTIFSLAKRDAMLARPALLPEMLSAIRRSGSA